MDISGSIVDDYSEEGGAQVENHLGYDLVIHNKDGNGNVTEDSAVYSFMGGWIIGFGGSGGTAFIKYNMQIEQYSLVFMRKQGD